MLPIRAPTPPPRPSAPRSAVVLALVVVLSARVFAFTEVFAITKDPSDNAYYVGNTASDFFIGKRNSICAFAWTSSAGSTTSDDDNDRNEQILYDVIVAADRNIYAVGSTRGDFRAPSTELPDLDAAIVVYHPDNGALVRQAQFDEPHGYDNVATSLVQKPDGTLLVAVHGSVIALDQSAVFETRLMEIDPLSLAIGANHTVSVTTTEIFAVSGGPKLLDFTYDGATDSIVAVGYILGRGMLWRYHLATRIVTAQAEWGTVFGSFQTSAFTTDGLGAFFVVGSSSANVLGNRDLTNLVSSEVHAYVIRYDALTTSPTSPTWVRQLSASGGSQFGNDIAMDPVTNDLVVVGTFDVSFLETDAQTTESFQVDAISDTGLTDIYVWVLNKDSGSYVSLRRSDVASTAAEDRANAVQVLSNRRLDIGGVIDDGIDSNPLVCDDFYIPTSPSLTPTPLPGLSVSPTPAFSLSVQPTATVSSSVSPSQLPLATASASLGAATSPAPSPSLTDSSQTPFISQTPPNSPPASLSPSASPQPPTGTMIPLMSPTPSATPGSAVSATPQSTGSIFPPSISSTPSETSGSIFMPFILPLRLVLYSLFPRLLFPPLK